MHMMKNRRIRWSIFLSLTLIMILGLSEVMKGNELTAVCNVKGFYQEEKDSLDAVVIGASEVYTSYSGIKAWEDYGYTSYAYGCPGLSGSLYKTVLKEVLRTQSPQVVAVEINGFIHGDEYLYHEGRFRNLVDNLNWSSNRVETILDEIPKEDQISFFFPLVAYHTNWKYPATMGKNLAAKILIGMNHRSVMKGYAGISRVHSFSRRKHKNQFRFNTDARKYLTEFLDYCKSRNLKNVLFFRAPHVNIPDHEEELTEVWDLVQSYGYDVLDLSRNLKKNKISIKNDFYNSEHLNVYGMEKVTSILGEYFTEHYAITKNHSDKTISNWNSCAQKAKLVFEKIKKDICEGNIRYYSELNVYMDTRILQVNELEE